MKDRLAALIGALRARGVPVSVAEAIDAATAAAAVGIERVALADALAAALVKDEGDRALFDECFARVFRARAAASAAARRRRSRTSAQEGGDAGAALSHGGGSGTRGRDSPVSAVSTSAAATAPRRSPAGVSEAPPSSTSHAPASVGREVGGAAGAAKNDEAVRGASFAACDDAGAPSRRSMARARALRALPFDAMSPRDVDEATVLVRALAQQVSVRLRRRLRPRPRWRLDFRRTLRAATPHGGVPLVRYFRGRRPRPPALVALCDLSASTATASDFFLALLAPAAAWFARVRLFGFVDRLVEIEFVDGRVRPAARLDLMARSDFGRVLADLTTEVATDLTADTVLLVLGDARNNRRPPRADLLRLARARVRRVVWLNPEPLRRWDSGDSVIGLYARHVDVLVPCGSIAELAAAVAAMVRR
ncbi:MAG: VWA domain-containing protein [Deltaproteobacteria bacterium]|nr:VWA domain-containing protein [Deltaproteobacteria bacterium]